MSLIDLIKNSYPKFITQIPSSKIKVSYRPLIVKEEKQLLTIQEFGSSNEKIKLIADLVQTCYENIDIKKLTITDLIFLFIQLRIKSIGNIVNTNLVCPFTKEIIPLEIDLESIEYTDSKNSSNIVELGPVLSIELEEPMTENLLKSDFIESEDILNIVIRSMVSINTNLEKIECKNQTREELESFLNALTKNQFSKLVYFFENASKIEKKIKYTTSDGNERELTMKGILDFFV